MYLNKGRFRRFAVAAVMPSLFVGSSVAAHASPALAASAKSAPAAKPKNELPKISVTDIKSGKPFDLQSAVDGKRATLVWFWAPH